MAILTRLDAPGSILARANRADLGSALQKD